MPGLTAGAGVDGIATETGLGVGAGGAGLASNAGGIAKGAGVADSAGGAAWLEEAGGGVGTCTGDGVWLLALGFEPVSSRVLITACETPWLFR